MLGSAPKSRTPGSGSKTRRPGKGLPRSTHVLAEGSDQGEDKELEVEVDVVGGADDCHGAGALLSAASLATVDGASEHGDTDGRLCTGTYL